MIGAIIAADHAERANPRLLEGEKRLAAGFGQPFPFGPKQLPLAHRLAALRAPSIKAADPCAARQGRPPAAAPAAKPSEADASRPASEGPAK